MHRPGLYIIVIILLIKSCSMESDVTYMRHRMDVIYPPPPEKTLSQVWDEFKTMWE